MSLSIYSKESKGKIKKYLKNGIYVTHIKYEEIKVSMDT